MPERPQRFSIYGPWNELRASSELAGDVCVILGDNQHEQFTRLNLGDLEELHAIIGNALTKSEQRVNIAAADQGDARYGDVAAERSFDPLDMNELREESARIRRFDVDAFVKKHGLVVVKERPARDGGRIFVLDKCPFNNNHDDECAYIIQYLNGNGFFCCHHKSCKLRTWADVVALCESPGQQDDAMTPSNT